MNNPLLSHWNCVVYIINEDIENSWTDNINEINFISPSSVQYVIKKKGVSSWSFKFLFDFKN